MTYVRILSFLFSFYVLSVSAQNQTVESRIIDESGKGISYATIGVIKHNFGIVAFDDGWFKIKIKEQFLDDSLTISALGYQDTIFAYRDFITRKPLQIILREDVMLLDEVVVQSSRIEFSEIGVLKKKSNSNFSISSPLKGAALVTRFNDNAESLLLKEIAVVVGKKNMNTVQLRCRVYSLHPITGLPDDNLLNESIVQSTERNKETLIFKMPENFWLHEPFYVGFEWVISKTQWDLMQETYKAYPTNFISDSIKLNPGYTTNIFEGKKLQFRDSAQIVSKEIKFTKEQRKLLKDREKVSPVLQFKILPKGTKTYFGSTVYGQWSLTPHEALVSIKVGKSANSKIDKIKTVRYDEPVKIESDTLSKGFITITEGELLPFASVDSFIDHKMDSLNIPGASIAIINDGKVVYHRVKGFSEKGGVKKVTKKTIFEGASISKSMFAYFVMKYVEDGLLDLDKPLFEYMEYPDISYDERHKKITARMVLCHRSGLPNWRTDTPGDSLLLQFEPGTRYLYSGEGYQYLAKVLAHVLETDDLGLEFLFQNRVAIPFGMEYTRFVQNDYNMINKAQPYVDGRWLKRKDMGNEFGAAFSIHSEALDFSKWMIRCLINGENLSKDSFDELTKEQTSIDVSKVENQKYGIQTYGLGFSRIETDFGTVFGHTGNNLGFSSLFYVLKEKGWGIAVFTNSEYGEVFGAEIAAYVATGDPIFFDR